MKRCTDELPSFNAQRLCRNAQLGHGSALSGSWSIGGRVHTVQLAWTPCAFGGHRAWWICPAPGCARRVAVLYAGRNLACRTCSGLAYRSQRETTADRAIRRADVVRKQLGWTPGIAHPTGDKPKGMKWRTFYRLRDKHDADVRKTHTAMATWLDSQRRRANLRTLP